MPIRKLQQFSNMSPLDRVLRFVIGALLAWGGFGGTWFGDSAVVNLCLGLFGVTNIASALAGVCPGYLVTQFSTRRTGTSADLNEAETTAVNSATLRIALSVTLPILLLLALVAYMLFDLSHDLSMSQDSTTARTAASVGLSLTSMHVKESNRDLSQDVALYQQLAAHPMAIIFHDSSGQLIPSPFEKLPADPALLGPLVDAGISNSDGESMMMTQGHHLIRSSVQGDNGIIATTLSHVASHNENTNSRVWTRFLLITVVLLWVGGWGTYSITRKFSQSLIKHAQAMKYRSTHDPLTGLCNRLGMEEVLETRISNIGSATESFALLLIDIADFRYFNDTLGYGVGDELIKVLSQKLQDNLSNGETIIRISGDVFCVIGPVGYDRTFAARLANQIHDLIEQPITVRDITLDMRCHVGVSMFPLHSNEGPELIRLADIALDQAKNSRCRTHYYQAEKDSHSIRKLSLLASLRSAIDENQLSVVYQPKVKISDGSLCGVEALVRWQHPVYNNVSPLEFIGWAEKTGLIDKLTCYVLRSTEKQCAQWRAQGYTIPVAVNLSPVNLQSNLVSDTIQNLVKNGGFGHGMLELELTENAVMEDPTSALESMILFKDLGVDIAIDDFGTGLASFSYLRKFPVSNLKIDRVFVTDSISQARDEVLLKSMIELGHNLDCVVTAEGVEDEPTLSVLRSYGCDFAQGYHLCKPTSAEGIVDWLQQQDTNSNQRKAA